MYFVSKMKMDIDILLPRIPDNYLTVHGWEDADTPRVCAAPTIGQCLTAIGCNLDGAELFVYEIYDDDYYTPNSYQVPDVSITGEVWYTHPVRIFYKGKILSSATSEDGFVFKYGPPGKLCIAQTYPWAYEWVSKNEE